MTSLNISTNNIGALVLPDGWTEDGFIVKTYKHSNGREQKEHPGKPEGVIALADAIKTNGALVKFTISGDQYFDNGYKDAPPVTIEASMTEADFSGKRLGTSGAIMLAAFLPKCQ